MIPTQDSAVGALCVIGLAALLSLITAGPAAARPKLTPVPFTAVRFTDRFWAPRLETNRTVTLPHNLKWCEDTGRIRNFETAGGLAEGKFEGIYFNDSDVYKVIEGAAYALAIHPDPDLDARLDDLIAKIAAAQQPDGYLNTYFTLVEPDKRWTNLPAMHELYCAGHLFEAAVAHYQATGKRNLLDVATRFADTIDQVFGEDALIGVPGHEEIELALVKLYEATGEERYFDLARFFIDQRGQSDREYCQDHLPVREQSEIVGHAVRAMYLYSGVADIAARTGDEALIRAMDRIWADVTERKMYVTGGVGPSSHNEGFTVPYDLPNDSAYAETCAAIGLVLWSQRMTLLHGRAEYADTLERALYNGVLSGVALSGDAFFYVNPLASHGRHHRQPWFGCACCPPNVLRLVGQVGGFVYATSDDGLWVNLYAGNEAHLSVGNHAVKVRQETAYPWSGDVKLTLEPYEPTEFALNLRLPGWCREAEVKVNGDRQPSEPGPDGYLHLRRTWQPGDSVQLTLAMPVERITAHPSVRADVGRVALMRGPVVYCLEGVDNGGSVRDIALPRTADLEAEFQPDLLGGVTVLRGRGRRRGVADWEGTLYQPRPKDDRVRITAVPYCAWDNRDPGEMVVWLPETTGLAEVKLPPTLAQGAEVAASHVQGDLHAINDGVLPASSGDLGVPRFTWWDHKGTEEWLSLTFPQVERVSRVEVYWFDDTGKGGCRTPAAWHLEWLDGEEWRPVSGVADYHVAADVLHRVDFDPVDTKGLRLVVQLQDGYSGGVLEWRVARTEGAE